MGCTREIHLIRQYLQYLTDKEMNKLASDILVSISANPIGLKYTLDYLFKHWNEIRRHHDFKEMSVLFNKISDANGFEVVSIYQVFI